MAKHETGRETKFGSMAKKQKRQIHLTQIDKSLVLKYQKIELSYDDQKTLVLLDSSTFPCPLKGKFYDFCGEKDFKVSP